MSGYIVTMSKHALTVTRTEHFPEWYQAVVRDADMAEASPVRGCMIVKPWGYGIWELLQRQLDDRIKAFGFNNCYFPVFIPMSFIAKEAEHVEGFAKEMAVVTHPRLKKIAGKLDVDPQAKLEEPLIVRPTSETIIGEAFHRWIQSYRDLPLRINQWANIVRWEMRTRLFLRTAEFLWQEGHSAHANEKEARESTMHALELYREFAETVLAIPTLAGEKPENERFPGADNTYSIEAMMQDGKALQAGTSHYLGTHFAEAQDIRYQNRDGQEIYCYTTSWGFSTRMVGGLVMTHGDDDGLRCPPAVAPRQIVIVPMLRDKPEDVDVLAFCDKLQVELSMRTCFGMPIRALVDKTANKSADKRWTWIRRGAPIIPRALIDDRSGPLAAGDRGQAVGRRRQPVPGLAAGRDDGLVVRPDAMAELVLPQVLPHVLDRVQLGRVGGQRQQGEVLGDGEAAGAVPPGTVEHDHAVRPGRDVAADLGQVQAGGRGIGVGQDEGGTDGALRADRPEQVGPGVPAVAGRPGPGAAPRPHPGQRALLADAGLVLEPDLDRLAAGALGQRPRHQLGEAFLNASRAASSAFGCLGRTERRGEPRRRGRPPRPQLGEAFLNASRAASSAFGCLGRTERRVKPSRRSTSPAERSCSRTAKRASIRARRSTRRQRTTPSRSGSGPCSTAAASSASCSGVRRGLRPDRGRSRRPVSPSSL